MSEPAHTIKSRVAAISVFASAGMAAAKFAVGIAIGSLALISEALHSSVDVVRDHHHLDGGAGFRPPRRRGASLRPRQARKRFRAGRHRPALCAGRRHSGRILEPPARGRAAADHLGHPVHRAADRYRREFLARPGVASHRARDQEPGVGGRRAAFRIRRARLDRRHRRAGAFGARAMPGATPPPPSRWRS